MSHNEARILVVGDNAVDVEQVCGMLRSKYPRVEASTDAGHVEAVFDRVKPQVLVLAFKSIGACERFYLGLYRRSEAIHTHSHRTLLLCDKVEVRRAYDLCLEDFFDDYVLYWPLVHDAMRLAMSVHLALCALEQEQALAPLAELSAMARRAEALEDQLAQQVRLGRVHAQNAQDTARQAQAKVTHAMGGLSDRILATGLDQSLEVRDPTRFRQAFGQLARDALVPTLEDVVRSAQPVRDWVDTITSELAEPLQAARDLAQRARNSRPLVLAVDDDQFMRRLLRQLLMGAKYDVKAVGSGSEAQSYLTQHSPHLILLDIGLPDGNGIELVRELKASRSGANIPIIMLTGNTERQVIVESKKAGAVDFLAKPFDREILLRKVAHHLGR